ncbi:hypothetical protein V7S43_004010 [Phytophthora oleae]|uniref:Uncharacterized protein n=1 Tax=Phytophthora oleae TaxID=2107226 RepID=A0ABD3FYU6_9STRA
MSPGSTLRTPSEDQPLAFITRPNRTGLVRDDTIVESFGEEHHFGKVLFDFKVKQIVRRYVVPDRVVVEWQAFLSPETFKGESLSGIQYEEKGAL